MEELIVVLMSWASLLSGYPLPDSYLTVVFISHEEIRSKACNGQPCKVFGWYGGGDTVYLDVKLNPQEDMYATSILVHELVHVLQQQKGFYGEQYSCSQAMKMEREAYHIQKEFLVRQGVYLPIGVSIFRTECEG